MKQLLIATHNLAKKGELNIGFSPLAHAGIQLRFLDNVDIQDDVAETGKTFEENAILKALHYSSLSNLPTVADDGGIEIDALNGQPGVNSKRWLGQDANDHELITYTLHQMKDIPLFRRTARFTVCLAYHNPQNNYTSSVTESLSGLIALSPSVVAVRGFPYRAIFVVSEYDKYYDELTNEEHHKSNHRLRAISRISPLIKADLIQ